MEIKEGNKYNDFFIKIYEILETNEISLKNIYQLETEHKDVIMSILKINNNNKIIIASASIDSTIRLNEINK